MLKPNEQRVVRFLLKLGCEEWQGHYFSEPLDASGFERLYRASLRSGKRA